MGRPSKLNPEVQKRICDALKTGAAHKHAAEYGGIDEATYYNWVDRGKKEGKGMFFEFFQAVKKTEAEAVTQLLATITLAARTHWQAACWILERRHPEEYGRWLAKEPAPKFDEEQAPEIERMRVIIGGKGKAKDGDGSPD